MTAVALTQRTARFRPARALRLEIKHSAGVWVLPVLAALFYVNAYRTAAGYPPTWTVRASVITQANLIFFSVIAAGIAAWVATREDRRKTGDLLATTARAAWARQATVHAATAFWMVLAYLAGVAVIYIQTALQATWGGPPLWPVAVGVVGVAASCALGFTCGTLFPGRFTAPIVAVAVFAAWFIGVNAANSMNNFVNVSDAKGTAALFVSTDGGRPQSVDIGVYHRVPPDVSIAQIMFMGGVLLVMVSLLALLPAARVPGIRGLSFANRRWLTMVAAVGIACGVAAAEIAGLPGAPARAEMTPGTVLPAAAGTTLVYDYSPDQEGFGGASFWATPAIARTSGWEQGNQQDFITWWVSGPAPQDSPTTPAQEAVAIALLAEIGAPVPQYAQFSQPSAGGASMSSGSGASGTQPAASAAQITAAARGFESLSPAARRAWLAVNIAALRSGAITLAQIP